MVNSCAFVGGDVKLERATGYRVTMPQQWSQTGSGEGDSAYRLPSGNVVTLTSSCNRDQKAPLDILTRHLLFGTRSVSVKERKSATFGTNTGLLSRVSAQLEKKPFDLELFVLSKGNCVFDFSLLSPKQISEKDSDSFHTFIGSFQYGN
ncbi:hypothetical protein K2X33_03220 [bacterium]|nr:hypothetical protein [bacterium]